MAERSWRPGSFIDLETEQQGRELDLAFRVAYDSLTQNESNSLQNPSGQDLRVTWGSALVTGSLTRIATDLATVVEVTASIDSDSAINENVTVALGDEGEISLFVWKPTGAGDTTPIASTTERRVRWVATGT